MKKNNLLGGVITALITPFYRGKIDFYSLEKLITQQLQGGVDGFVVNGTTGESPTLTDDEVKKIFNFVKKTITKIKPKKDVWLILGTGTNSTASTVLKTKLVKKLKADAALVVVPYYNKPTQDGLVAHFTAVAKQTSVPIILYNVPGRTVVSLSHESTKKLSVIKNIVGIKEASGQLQDLDSKIKEIKKNFAYISGDDASCIEFMKLGGGGVISVISHLIPGDLVRLSRLARGRDASVTLEYSKYEKLNGLLGVEPNPVPVKMALYLMGLIRSPEMRLPLVPLSKNNTEKLKNELNALGLIK